MDVGIIVAIVALIGTVINGLITLRADRPGALQRLSSTITELTAELDTERERRKIQQAHFQDVIIKMESRMFEIEEKERKASAEMRRLQRKNTRNIEIIKILLQQLESEGLVPDAKPDTGELA